MSQCPICNAATWIGQRYCSTCDSYLPNPGEEDHFCPKCGIRVAPQQEICHKCNASLPEMAGASFQTMTRARRRPPWVLGICIGTGLVIVVLLLVFLFNKSPGPPQLMVPPPSPPASGQTPATSPPKVETAPSAPTAPAAQEPSRPISTSNPFSPESDDTNTITAHVLCEHPLPGPPGWPHHVCTSDRHPQLQRRGGTPGHLGRMGEDSGGAAQSCRLVQYALFGAGDS